MIPVRMGELVVSSRPGEELVALGLGSCIGLAIVDQAATIAGLVHVVLPESAGHRDSIGKFADTAVPELVSKVLTAGASRRRLQIVLCGGARMFDVGVGLDIGLRNTEAVREALSTLGLRPLAAETGGRHGRTLRVSLPTCEVTCRSAGSDPLVLLPGPHGRHQPTGRPQRTLARS